MIRFRKYIPAALLFVGIGLSFNTSCNQDLNNPKLRIEQNIKKESDKSYTLDGRKYTANELIYVGYDNKDFLVGSKIKVLDEKKQIQYLYTTYHCYTNTKGEFDEDVLILSETPDYYDQKRNREEISGKVKNSSEFQIESVNIYKNNTNIFTNKYTEDTKREKYFKYGLEKFYLFNKLLNIEEIRKQSKGKNLYHLLEEFDLEGLALKKSGENKFSGNLGSIRIFADFYDGWTSIRLIKDPTCIRILDNNGDGEVDYVAIEKDHMSNITLLEYDKEESAIIFEPHNTVFEIKDFWLFKTYRYIKDIYTEEQAKDIFSDAQQKLDFIKRTRAKIGQQVVQLK